MTTLVDLVRAGESLIACCPCGHHAWLDLDELLEVLGPDHDAAAWSIGRHLVCSACGRRGVLRDRMGVATLIHYHALTLGFGTGDRALLEASRMCNLYSITKGPAAILEFTRATRNAAGNLQPLPGVFPDYAAPIVRVAADGERELATARWGMPSPVFALKGKSRDPGVTNVRNTKSPHWRRWLTPAHRCLVPLTSFSEPHLVDKKPVWFAANADRPLMVFAGIWVGGWKSVRKVKEGEVEADLYAFLTTEPNAIVAPVHPKAMPVILTTAEEMTTWMEAPWEEASALQRPLPEAALRIVAHGERKDGESQ